MPQPTREFTTPPIPGFDPGEVLTDAAVRNAVEHPDRIAFVRRDGDQWVPVTTKEFASLIRQVAAGLVARGVAAGDRVALMSRTRFEWTVLDYAIWTAGAVTVPVYETSSAEQVEWILSDSGAVAVLVESAEHEQTVAAVRGAVPGVSTVLSIDGGAIETLVADGAAVPETELDARRQAMTGTTLATIIYTSGTTGRPKGCELDHGALLAHVQAVTGSMPEVFTPGESSTLMFLPLAHVFGRTVQCGCVLAGVRIGYTPDVKNLLADLQSFSPDFVLSVPRVFEKVYNGVRAKAAAEGKARIIDLATTTAVAYSQALDTRGPGLGLRLRHKLFDALVYSKLRAATGGKMRNAVSGGAPLGTHLGHFFRGAGITILEGYGLTETSAGATINVTGKQRVGTVGPPTPGTTIRIAEDGEVLLKGRQVFRGYWKNPQATAEILDQDGWFHTGDLGSLDVDGYLTITGRKKEIIVTAGGKNVSPAVLEDRMRRHPLISQVMVVGDNRPFIAALVTLDEEALPGWLSTQGRPSEIRAEDLADDPILLAEIQEAVDDANLAVSRAEAIRKIRVLPEDFSEEGGTLTPSMKVKRSVVAQHYAEQIEQLYTR